MHTKNLGIVSLGLGALLLAGCFGGGDDNPAGPEGPDDGTTTFDAAWPADLATVLTTRFEDGVGDQEAMPPEQAGPPYSAIIPFPPVDIESIAMGVEGDFLYMRVDYAGVIPTESVRVPPGGEVAEQWIGTQGMSIALNTDGDMQSGGGGEGVSGIDIFFAVAYDYGVRNNVYSNWEFPDGDLHHQQNHREGEFGEGGPGYDYAVVRYDVSGLGAYLPFGEAVDIGSWSEAESFTEAGALLYHHFAFDRAIDGGQWSIPMP